MDEPDLIVKSSESSNFYIVMSINPSPPLADCTISIGGGPTAHQNCHSVSCYPVLVLFQNVNREKIPKDWL